MAGRLAGVLGRSQSAGQDVHDSLASQAPLPHGQVMPYDDIGRPMLVFQRHEDDSSGCAWLLPQGHHTGRAYQLAMWQPLQITRTPAAPCTQLRTQQLHRVWPQRRSGHGVIGAHVFFDGRQRQVNFFLLEHFAK